MGFGLALQEDSRLVLESAICLYKSAAGEGYATAHGIERNGQAPTLGAGVPLSRKAIGNVIAMLGKGANNGSFLSAQILSIGYDYMMWWEAPTTRSIFFKERPDGDGKTAIGTRSGMTPQPGLVFMASGGGWKVFAVKGSDRPTPTTELFHSPYWNVNSAGAICTGNVKLPSVDPECIADWTKAFFSSNFTHTNFHGAKQVEGKGGFAGLWNELLDGKHKKFPEKRLLKTDKTIAQIIQSINRGGN